MWKNIIVLFCLLHSGLCWIENSLINFGGFVCPREEKALGKCLKNSLNVYIPQLAAGLPEFDIPPCEPLVVPLISIHHDSGAISVMSSYHNVTIRGPSTMRIRDVTVDHAKHEIMAKVYIPELRLKGHYKLKGQLLVLPIEGEGKFTAVYGDINALLKIVLGRLRRPNMKDAVSCENLEVQFHVGHASMKIDNLFGDGKIGDALNMFLNENWQKLAEELQTPLEKALKDFLKPLADHAFATLNANEIL